MAKRPITSLQEFYFSSEAYFGGNSFVSANRKDWRGAHWDGPFRRDEEFPKHKTSKEQWQQLTELVKKLQLHEWEREYLDRSGFCDGTEWELFIQYNGSLKRRSSGYMVFPDGYDELQDGLEKIFLMERENGSDLR